MEQNKQNEQPLMVTIRCITYNHEPYIRDCLEGFVMQQTNFRFEAIVHDDASTDGTAAIIKEYAEKYPDIIKPIFETENQYSKHDGSLNRIMNEHTHGKYVAYCEGDDYWIDPLKLQKQVDFLEEHPDYSMCWTDAYQETNGEKKAYHRYPTSMQTPIKDIIEQGGLWIPTASTIYRSEIPLTLPKDTISCDYTMQMFGAFNGKAYYIEDQTCVYRYMSIGSWTSNVGKETIAQTRKRFEGEKKILEQFNKISNQRYSEYFERRSAIVLFKFTYFLKMYSEAREYLLLRDKYNIPTPKVVRLDVNGLTFIAQMYRLYAKIKIKLIDLLK